MTKISRTMLAACAAIALTCSAGHFPAYGQEPDNSGQNKAQSQTADDQTSARSDRLLTANVRKAIVGDKDLSTYAHNVKIITRDGHVTLKGPVKSEEEKKQVLTDAANAVSAENISNELTVKE
jgi:hyperosmotically inducible periplasmic protein